MGKKLDQTNAKAILPIFDQAEYLEFNTALPLHLKAYQDFEQDYLGAHAFLVKSRYAF